MSLYWDAINTNLEQESEGYEAVIPSYITAVNSGIFLLLLMVFPQQIPQFLLSSDILR